MTVGICRTVRGLELDPKLWRNGLQESGDGLCPAHDIWVSFRALHQFHIAFLCSSTNNDSPGDANQIGILKFDTGTFSAIID